jgi:DNA-binding CsgD family transcriptional regulator
VHKALADATDEHSDMERYVWHLAAATMGPDERVASELEAAADEVQARAGVTAAAAFLQRAFELSSDPVRRTDRALAAAQAHLQAGSFDIARSLGAEAGTVSLADLHRARLEQLSGQIEAAAKPGGEGPVRLLNAAIRLESLDVRRARETYLQAWWAAVVAGKFAAPGGELRAIASAALSAPRVPDPRTCDLLLDGLATVVMKGRAAAAPLLRPAIERFLAEETSRDDWIQWGRSATTAAFAIWDVGSWLDLSSRQVELARASGALTPLVLSLNLHVFGRAYCGDMDGATSLVAEQNAAREATGIAMASYGARLLAAYQGRPMGVSPALAASDDEFMHSGDGYALQVASLTTAILNNGLSRYTDAVAAAEELVAYDFSFAAPLALSELIEGAVRSGSTERADDALQRFSSMTVAGSDWAAGLEARGRALVSVGDAAEHWYAESIDCLARTPLRPELARAHLLYGEWLRRESRRADARGELRAAFDQLSAMGMDAFAERAARELAATGEKVRRRAVETSLDLTPQELQVARLAAEGGTNPEIGSQLFISARTVEYHLRKVFTKLAVSSRKELRTKLQEPRELTGS